jgi:DNA-binding beta-propeller fold protein YncE
MYTRKHPRMRRASGIVGLAMMLGGTMALTALIGTSTAQAAPAHRAIGPPAWTAYVTSEAGSTVTPINLATNTPGTPIPVGNDPLDIAITPNGSTAYVTTGNSGVTPINLATKTAETPIKVSFPSAIAITPNGTMAYVTTGNSGVTPINLATNTPGTLIPVKCCGAIAITPNGSTAYVTDTPEGTVTPINLATNTPGLPITGVVGPGAIAITPNGSTAYVTSDGQGAVTPINLATNTPGTPIPVKGANPNAIQSRAVAIAPKGAAAYLALGVQGVNGPGAVVPINTATNTAARTLIPVGTNPSAIAITPNGSTAYVPSFGCIALPSPIPFPPSLCPVPDPDDNIVIPINTATKTPGTQITVGVNPFDIAITPDQAPVAHLSVTPAEAGQPTGLDASASTVAFGTISSYAWDFGAGSTATTSKPTISHIYAAPGAYTATVTETDSTGTSTTQVFTGQTMSNNGGPSAVSSQHFTVVPQLPMAVTTTSVPPGTAGTLYSTTLRASGGNPPYKWSIISGSLPVGLHLRRSTGVLTGKPTVTGTFTFTVQVVDQKSTFKPHTQNTATSTLSLTIF